MIAMHQACWPRDIGAENQTQGGLPTVMAQPGALADPAGRFGGGAAWSDLTNLTYPQIFLLGFRPLYFEKHEKI